MNKNKNNINNDNIYDQNLRLLFMVFNLEKNLLSFFYLLIEYYRYLNNLI